MGAEDRVIKASIAAGITEIIVGVVLVLLHFADWYFNHFHFFGILGFGLLEYGLWHAWFKSRGVFAA